MRVRQLRSGTWAVVRLRPLVYAHTQAALFIAGCGVVGAVGGLIYGMVRKERHA